MLAGDRGYAAPVELLCAVCGARWPSRQRDAACPVCTADRPNAGGSPAGPEAEYEAAFYRTDDGGYGFPVIAFKAATVSAARFYGKQVSMTSLRQFVFVDGPFSKTAGQKLAPITGEPHMREDVTRVGMGGTDLRYRPEFTEWSTVLEVVYVKSMLTRDSVLSLVNAGGMGVGVGEWRPERKGDFGTYTVDETREIEVVR